ncbi:hypothetical protein SBD_6520 [Streptomyces bottropensis ATCC 25435]|uniref:Uncharacterized protein n=1 Tax=Streptomyces bottropensis ATCC 25435 TaxID=1054862 RepID=M3FIY3_9ACTN|nr:hypothetical protein SBD_6520 [Streptomyces bottropensis ATCC 25435]
MSAHLWHEGVRPRGEDGRAARGSDVAELRRTRRTPVTRCADYG